MSRFKKYEILEVLPDGIYQSMGLFFTPDDAENYLKRHGRVGGRFLIVFEVREVTKTHQKIEV